MREKIARALALLREWARDYEPAVAKSIVTAFLQILVVAGISLGNLPNVIDAVLAFVAVVATLLAGRSIRNSVVSPALHRFAVQEAERSGYSKGVFDVRRKTRP